MGKTVLITGCSTGIGRATAREFADAGWTVYATARDVDQIRDLNERGCHAVRLDVTDGGTVRAAVDRVFEEQGHLDCVVNNAGYGQFGAVEDVPMGKIVEQFDVNTFGPLRLVHAALPRMRDHGGGTIVNVTAGVKGVTVPGLGIYTASKFALESATDALRQETSSSGVDVVMVEPGFVATDFYDRALSEIDSIEHAPVYADLYRVLGSIGVVEKGGPGINRPERVAATILEAATADRPDPTYRVGPSAVLGTYVGAAVRGRLRDALFRWGIKVLSNEWVQRVLRRRANA